MVVHSFGRDRSIGHRSCRHCSKSRHRSPRSTVNRSVSILTQCGKKSHDKQMTLERSQKKIGPQWCRMSVPSLNSFHVLWCFTFSYYSSELFVLCSHSCKWDALICVSRSPFCSGLFDILTFNFNSLKKQLSWSHVLCTCYPLPCEFFCRLRQSHSLIWYSYLHIKRTRASFLSCFGCMHCWSNVERHAWLHPVHRGSRRVLILTHHGKKSDAKQMTKRSDPGWFGAYAKNQC